MARGSTIQPPSSLATTQAHQARAASLATLTALVLGSATPIARADDSWALESVGIRYATSATGFDDFYWQLEPDVRWRIPLSFEVGTHWHLDFHASLTVGWIASRGDHGVIGSLGPLLSLGRSGVPLHFEGGLSPTFMDRFKFGEDDLGSYVQFTTHTGVYWDISRHWSVGYRFQHMSNAGLDERNPGLNLHALQCFYRF